MASFSRAKTGIGPTFQTALARANCFRGTVGEFIEAKLEERSEPPQETGRPALTSSSPTSREGKGGLRDLQTLYWIAKYEHGVQRGGRAGRSRRSFLPEEFAAFDAAERFLVGHALHPAPDRGPRSGPVEPSTTRSPLPRGWAITDHSGRRAGRAFHAGLFPPRHPRGRIEPALFTDRARGRVTSSREPAILGFLRGRTRRKKAQGRAMPSSRTGSRSPTNAAFFRRQAPDTSLSPLRRRRCARATSSTPTRCGRYRPTST